MTHQVTVVGGGPAGLIAAEMLATAGVTVNVHEHRRSVGRKFLLAGRGGLNITHGEPLQDLLDRYSTRGVIEASIEAFPPSALRAWCEGLGEPTFVGSSNRVFPESFRATPLLRAWLGRLATLGVTTHTGSKWLGWDSTGANRFEAPDETVKVDRPDATILALGGASWPRVGSTGGWVPIFEAAGITVAPLLAANSGITVNWSPVMLSRFAGAPIKNTVFMVGDRSKRGDAVITASGLEGGPVYGLGPAIRDQLHRNETEQGEGVLVRLDLFPDLSHQSLTMKLAKRRAKASVTSWLNSAGIPAIAVALARDATSNQLPEHPADLAQLLKALPLEVTGTAEIDRAISTAGGVRMDQIDDHLMVTKRPGLFVAGEMLDWEAPTGGYLLQACFSTGVAAAHGVLTWLGQKPVDAQPSGSRRSSSGSNEASPPE